MRPGLEQKAPDLAPDGGDQAGDDDEEEDEAFDVGTDATYATLTADSDAPDAWQSPMAGTKSNSGGGAEGSSSSAVAGDGRENTNDSGASVLDAATSAKVALQGLSDAAPRAHGVQSLPPSAHAAAAPIDVASLPPDLLSGLKLPAAGKWVRTAYDHNLDGLSGEKPWRPPASAAAAAAAAAVATTSSSQAVQAAARAQAESRLPEFFNYGLTEAAWVVYARKQREVILSPDQRMRQLLSMIQCWFMRACVYTPIPSR